MAQMRELAPRLQRMKEQFGDDRQKMQQAMMALYKTEKINPMGGCLPILVQIPVFISLYRALQNLIAENKLSEPFLWIPDLEGPTYSSSAGEAAAWYLTHPLPPVIYLYL